MRRDERYSQFTIRKLGCSAALLASLLLAAIRPANSQGKKFETIDAHAIGTGTQVGGRTHIRVIEHHVIGFAYGTGDRSLESS
jgi:hypothetical protein